jgi:hypothetical protein
MPAVQGSSLVPITQGQPGPHAALLIEEDQPFGIDGLPGPVRFRTIITPQVRLTQISGQGVIEMYDRRTDPAELHNLVNSPAGADLRAEGTTAMLDEVVRLIDDSVVPFHAA